MRAFVLNLLVLALCSACALEQRASEKLVDPTLRANAPELRLAANRLGAVHVLDVHVDERPEGVATALGLTMKIALDPAKPMLLTCEGKRSPTGAADYAALADDTADHLELRCRFGDTPWVFEIAGSLDGNLLGELRSGSRKLDVEVLLHRKVWNAYPRRLAVPLAQVLDRKTAAATILARPTRTWVNPDLAPGEVLPVVGTLLALRLAPVRWEE